MECGWRSKNISIEISKLNSLRNSILVFFSLLLISGSLNASEETLINLKGEYLAYSYDFNQIYGENVEFEFSSYSVSCRHTKIDITPRIFYAYGDVILEKGDERLNGDEFLFDPRTKKGTLHKNQINVIFKARKWANWLYGSNPI